MKTTILIIILAFASTITFAQKCFISGEIKGFGNDTLSIMFLPMKHGETPIIDQVICVNGKLNYEVALVAKIPHLVRISSKKWDDLFSVNVYPYYFNISDINFFLNAGDKINFTAEPGSNGNYLQAFGNQLNENRNELLKSLYPLHKEYNSACFKFADAKKTKDSLLMKPFIKLLDDIIGQINANTIDFIVNHPDWEISAEVLMGLPMDSCYKYFPTLSKKVQNSYFGKYDKDVLYALKPGDKAVPFSLTDPTGKTVLLSDFKGKYVVLEFWGTWCGWCVKDIPTMKKYYAKYKSKAAFIGIACRDNETNWKKAIEKYEIDWISLLNNDEKLTQTYGIEGYPTKIIINPEGIVAGKFLGEGREFYTEFDKLFKN